MSACACFWCGVQKCRCHGCKIDLLQRHLPMGVPQEEWMERCKACNVSVRAHDGPAERGHPVTETYIDGAPWPATFGVLIDGVAVHQPGHGGTCFQCLHCKHYDQIDSDWGTCRNAESQYHEWEVFEHWTCKGWEAAPEEEDG